MPRHGRRPVAGSGGIQHITQSLQTVARYAPPGQVAPDFQGAIGVTDHGVAGVDIPVPVYRWVERHLLADDMVTEAYRRTLSDLTGSINAAAFRGYAVGEVRFEGAIGQRRGYGDWPIEFHFAASRNVTDRTIGNTAQWALS